MRVMILLGALVPFAAAAGASDDVRCAEIGFSLAAEQHDLDAFKSFIDADARFVGSSVAHGPDEVAMEWAAFFKPDGPGIAWRPRLVEVLESGDLALTRGPYRLETVGEDGHKVVRWGTFNSVWRLGRDGRWRVVFDAGAPANETPSESSIQLLAAPVTDCPKIP